MRELCMIFAGLSVSCSAVTIEDDQGGFGLCRKQKIEFLDLVSGGICKDVKTRNWNSHGCRVIFQLSCFYLMVVL